LMFYTLRFTFMFYVLRFTFYVLRFTFYILASLRLYVFTFCVLRFLSASFAPPEHTHARTYTRTCTRTHTHAHMHARNRRRVVLRVRPAERHADDGVPRQRGQVHRRAERTMVHYVDHGTLCGTPTPPWDGDGRENRYYFAEAICSCQFDNARGILSKHARSSTRSAWCLSLP
jgi:hypothetical protein